VTRSVVTHIVFQKCLLGRYLRGITKFCLYHRCRRIHRIGYGTEKQRDRESQSDTIPRAATKHTFIRVLISSRLDSRRIEFCWSQLSTQGTRLLSSWRLKN